jgi:hypothetical protein
MANLHYGAPNPQQVSTFRTTLPYRRLARGRRSVGGTTRCNERPDATTCGLSGTLEEPRKIRIHEGFDDCYTKATLPVARS